jgi:hypothetical protein
MSKRNHHSAGSINHPTFLTQKVLQIDFDERSTFFAALEISKGRSSIFLTVEWYGVSQNPTSFVWRYDGVPTEFPKTTFHCIWGGLSPIPCGRPRKLALLPDANSRFFEKKRKKERDLENETNVVKNGRQKSSVRVFGARHKGTWAWAVKSNLGDAFPPSRELKVRL